MTTQEQTEEIELTKKIQPLEPRPRVAKMIEALLGPPHWGYYCSGFNPSNKPTGYIRFAFHCKECENELRIHTEYMAAHYAYKKKFIPIADENPLRKRS